MPLRIDNLSARFGNKWVFRDIAFEVADGKIFGVCGTTASGKSTLLNAIAGGLKISGGAIILDSLDLIGRNAKGRGIKLLTDAGTAGLLGLFGSSSKDSSGERQLRAFDKAISFSGKVLLLDDPFSRMDAQGRLNCFQKVRQWADSDGRVVIFASSDFNQIALLTDDVAVLSGGYIIQIGRPQQIYENPDTTGVALSSGETNLFKARRLTSTDADLPEFQTIDGGHRIFTRRVEKSRLGAINQNMTLAIRPEQISISMGASFPEDNLLRAVVTCIKFCGSTSLIEFDATGLRLKARVFKIVGLQPGDECMLGLPPERVLVLRD